MSHFQKKEEVLKSASTDSALIAAPGAGYRECFPKKIELEINLDGNDPPTTYNIVSSSPVPQDHVFHLRKSMNLITTWDPPAGFPPVAGFPTNMLGTYYIVVDRIPIWCGFLRVNGTTNNAGAVSADRARAQNVYNHDYFITHGSIISIFAIYDYNSGIATTESSYNVTVIGDIIKMPAPMARGKRDPIGPAAFPTWITLIADFLL